MKRFLLIISVTAMFAVSCIKNDIPYPVVVPHITSMEVEGAKSVTLNVDKKTAIIDLEEQTDICNVNIISCEIDEEKTRLSTNIVGTHDLTKPLRVTMSIYQDYVWTITATKNIERYFTVDGQIGAAVIDVENHRVVVYVRKAVVLSSVTVNSLKLGPADVTTYSCDISEIKDFSTGVFELDVTAFDKTENWHIFIEHSDFTIKVKKVNPWTKEAYLTADGVAGLDNGFKYRKAGQTEWADVPSSMLTSDGGQFTAHITGLDPETEYEFYAFSGSDKTQPETFTTDPETQAPNHSFDYVSLVTGKDYYKWYDPSSSVEEARTMFWGTGNGEGPDGIDGTSSLGMTLTFPDLEAAQDGMYCVRCESRSLLGMLACGNIFTGHFAGIVGTTGGKVHYGRPWTTRPKALRFKVKYNCGKIDIIGTYPASDPVKKGDPDRCHIIATVGDWDFRQYGGDADSPVLVNTSEEIFFTKESEGIIGYGEYIRNSSTDWIEVEIPIEYRSIDKRPTHIILICAASLRGDYLTGSSKSVLWVDDFDLIY